MTNINPFHLTTEIWFSRTKSFQIMFETFAFTFFIWYLLITVRIITNPGGFLWDRSLLAMTYVVNNFWIGQYFPLMHKTSIQLLIFICARFLLAKNCTRGYSFVYIMSVRKGERQFEPEFLRQNEPLQKGWLDTVKAVYHILSAKLFQREYESVYNYRLCRGNGCCKRNTFYRLSNARKSDP